jgi:hypothetical protein
MTTIKNNFRSLKWIPHNAFYLNFFPEKDGKQLEEAVNKTGPGEALFVKCDVTKEAEIKVGQRSNIQATGVWLCHKPGFVRALKT